MSKDQFKNLNGEVSWYGANYVYEDIYIIQDKIREAMLIGDSSAVLMNFDELLMAVMPYIHKKMTEKDKLLFKDNSDIYKLESEYKNGKTDVERSHNVKIQRQILQEINKKRMRLSWLMAEAGLGITLKPREEDRPAALATDDW